MLLGTSFPVFLLRKKELEILCSWGDEISLFNSETDSPDLEKIIYKLQVLHVKIRLKI